jgi:hypothetical protein
MTAPDLEDDIREAKNLVKALNLAGEHSIAVTPYLVPFTRRATERIR